VFIGGKNIWLSQVLYVSVKKETLKLQGFEKSLLSSYRIYLQRLEKFVSVLNKKRGNAKAASEVKLSLMMFCVVSTVENCKNMRLFVFLHVTT
jgi:hypothetical protein